MSTPELHEVLNNMIEGGGHMVTATFPNCYLSYNGGQDLIDPRIAFADHTWLNISASYIKLMLLIHTAVVEEQIPGAAAFPWACAHSQSVDFTAVFQCANNP